MTTSLSGFTRPTVSAYRKLAANRDKLLPAEQGKGGGRGKKKLRMADMQGFSRDTVTAYRKLAANRDKPPNESGKQGGRGKKRDSSCFNAFSPQTLVAYRKLAANRDKLASESSPVDGPQHGLAGATLRGAVRVAGTAAASGERDAGDKPTPGVIDARKVP